MKKSSSLGIPTSRCYTRQPYFVNRDGKIIYVKSTLVCRTSSAPKKKPLKARVVLKTT